VPSLPAELPTELPTDPQPEVETVAELRDDPGGNPLCRAVRWLLEQSPERGGEGPDADLDVPSDEELSGPLLPDEPAPVRPSLGAVPSVPIARAGAA